MADSTMTEVEAFHATTNWSPRARWTTTLPTPVLASTEHPHGFYHGDTYFDADALSLIACCAMHSRYPIAKTAAFLSQQQNLPLQRIISVDDLKIVWRKIALENSTAFATLSDAKLGDPLVCAILAPMAGSVESHVRMPSFFPVPDYEIQPTQNPRSAGPQIPRSIGPETSKAKRM